LIDPSLNKIETMVFSPCLLERKCTFGFQRVRVSEIRVPFQWWVVIETGRDPGSLLGWFLGLVSEVGPISEIY
jgi:hypothetical protein